MHARIVALLLIVATLWSLISVQDFDPSFDSDGPSRIVVLEASAADPGSREESRLEQPRFELQDRVWSAQAEIPADLPDVLPDQVSAHPARAETARLLRERWLAPLPPYLDGPRRPPRRTDVA